MRRVIKSEVGGWGQDENYDFERSETEVSK